MTVPDLRSRKLALSSVFFQKEQKPQAVRASAQAEQPFDARSRLGIPIFSIGDVASYHFIAYNVGSKSGSKPGPTLELEITKGDKVIYDATGPLAARTIRTDSKGAEVSGQLRLSLDPGVYTLHVKVKEAKSAPAEQTVDFQLHL